MFIVNINDQVENILPSMRHNKLRSKMWICDEYSKSVDPDVIKILRKIFEDFMGLIRLLSRD